MPDRSIVSVLIVFAALLATIPTYHEMIRADAPSGGGLTSGFHTYDRTGASPDHSGHPANLTSITIRPGGDAVPHTGPGTTWSEFDLTPLDWAMTGGTASEAGDAPTSLRSGGTVTPAANAQFATERGW